MHKDEHRHQSELVMVLMGNKEVMLINNKDAAAHKHNKEKVHKHHEEQAHKYHKEQAHKHHVELGLHKNNPNPKEAAVMQHHAVKLALPLSVRPWTHRTDLRCTQDEYQNYKSYIRTAMKCTRFCRPSTTRGTTTSGALIDEWGRGRGAHTQEVWCIVGGC